MTRSSMEFGTLELGTRTKIITPLAKSGRESTLTKNAMSTVVNSKSKNDKTCDELSELETPIEQQANKVLTKEL